MPEFYSLYINIFKNGEPGSIFRQIYDKDVKDNPGAIFPEERGALERLMQEQKMAMFYNQEALLDYEEFRCDILAPWLTKYPGFLTLAFPKNSAYFPFFQYQTIRYFENGVIEVLRNRWTTFKMDHCLNTEPTSLGLEKLISLFGLLGTSALLALVVFCFEKVAGFGGGPFLSSAERSKVDDEMFFVQSVVEGAMQSHLNRVMLKFSIGDRRLFMDEMRHLLALAKN